MYPDDCGECEICGVPVFGMMGGVGRCPACEGIVNLPRDAKGRWVRPGDLCEDCGGWGYWDDDRTAICTACNGTGRKQAEGATAK